MQNVMKLFNVLRIVCLLSVNEGDISILILPLRFSDLYCALELDTSDSVPAFRRKNFVFLTCIFLPTERKHSVELLELNVVWQKEFLLNYFNYHFDRPYHIIIFQISTRYLETKCCHLLFIDAVRNKYWYWSKSFFMHIYVQLILETSSNIIEQCYWPTLCNNSYWPQMCNALISLENERKLNLDQNKLLRHQIVSISVSRDMPKLDLVQ